MTGKVDIATDSNSRSATARRAGVLNVIHTQRPAHRAIAKCVVNFAPGARP